MCLLILAFQIHPDYPVIVAANRDEFFRRPSLPAHFWEDHPEILAGRDLEKMGTWMGISKSGRFAGLTNFRDPRESTEGKRSRGELVTGALRFPGPLQEFMKKLSEQDDQYPGYNLLAGDHQQCYYYSNKEGKVRKLEPGIYGLSNALLDTPWPKVEFEKKEMVKILKKDNNPRESLFRMLSHAEPFPDDQLPNTGIPVKWERKLSPLFIEGKDYGTRCSTVVLFGRQEIEFAERNYEKGNQKEYRFRIPLSDLR